MKIKGKEYIEVSERVKQFREGFKDYRLVTMIAHMEQDRVIFKAEVYDDKDRLVSTGYAEELKGEPLNSYGKENINYDNYVEIAETSAVGRALGFLGIGINSGIASADEVVNAVTKQETRTVSRPSEVKTETKTYETVWWDGVSPIKQFDHFMIGDIEYITMLSKNNGGLFGLAVDKSITDPKVKYYQFM